MSFITESKKAYKQVKENHVAIAMGKMLDDEGSMLLNQLEELERGIEMLRAYVGNDYEKQLPAWVQSKVTLATDYISTAGNYLSSKNEKVTEETIKESSHLTESTFEKIYQMQQDGKSTEDIAKELKLNPALVKKVLGEQIELKEFTDAMLAALKKEYEPLKGKTITTAQYQQLKNILFKLQDADLEKLQKQNIPFASTGAGSILRVRKSPVKITSVKVPGLEGMAEEKIPQGYLDYLRTIVYKKVDFYEIPPKHIIQHWRDEKNKDRFTGKIIDYKEGSVIEEPNNPYAIGMAAAMKATGDTPPLKKSTITKAHKIADKVKEEEVNKTNPKSDEKRTIDMTDGSAHVRFPKDDTKAMEFYKSKGYKVTTKYEEVEIQEEPKLNQKELDKFHTSLDKLVHKTFGSSSDEKKKQEPKKEEVKEPTGDLKDACWTGYVAVGTKMKNGKRVPNCVPKSEAYKGAKAIVENAFKKLKEKK